MPVINFTGVLERLACGSARRMSGDWQHIEFSDHGTIVVLRAF